MRKLKRRCCFLQCLSNNLNSKLYNFPRVCGDAEVERCTLWRDRSQNSLLKRIPVDQIYGHFYVCYMHFKKDQFTKWGSSKLKKTAVPDIEYNQESESIRLLENDAENWIRLKYYRKAKVTLKKTVVPHIFECQTDRSTAQPSKDRPFSAIRARRSILQGLLSSVKSTSKPTSASPGASDSSTCATPKNFSTSKLAECSMKRSSDLCESPPMENQDVPMIINPSKDMTLHSSPKQVWERRARKVSLQRKCCAVGCTGNNVTSSMYSFPRISSSNGNGLVSVNDDRINRCKTWLSNVGNPDLSEVPLSELSKYFLCSKHFTNDQFHATHLKQTAVPTIFSDISSVSVRPTDIQVVNSALVVKEEDPHLDDVSHHQMDSAYASCSPNMVEESSSSEAVHGRRTACESSRDPGSELIPRLKRLIAKRKSNASTSCSTNVASEMKALPCSHIVDENGKFFIKNEAVQRISSETDEIAVKKESFISENIDDLPIKEEIEIKEEFFEWDDTLDDTTAQCQPFEEVNIKTEDFELFYSGRNNNIDTDFILEAKSSQQSFLDESENEDNLSYCYDCNQVCIGDCTKHGPLVIVNNPKVSTDVGVNSYAINSTPSILRVGNSESPDFANGVFARQTLPNRMRFGPMQGKIVSRNNMNSYTWVIRDSITKSPLRYIDLSEPCSSNWMRYIKIAEIEYDKNCIVYQSGGQLYLRTIREISPQEEIIVGPYDSNGLLIKYPGLVEISKGKKKLS